MTAKHTHRKAKTIDELRRYCKPTPLADGELDSYYVETDKARDPYQHTRQRLAKSLEHEPSRILFYGHKGCGKSTELNKFIAEQGDKWLPVKFSVLDEMTPVNALAEDLILVITAQIMQAAENIGIRGDERLLNEVHKYFATVTTKNKETTNAEAVIAAGVDTGGSVLGKLVGLMVRIKAEIKVDSHSEETIVHTLRKRPADLLIQANRVIEAIQTELKDRGQRLLVIVEGIDKLGLKQARGMFVDNITLLTGLTTDIIYTIPIHLYHSPDCDAFRHYFDSAICLPMIKVYDPETKMRPGLEVIESLIKKRVDDALIEPDALRLLIDKTGGVLRHVFEVLNIVSTMTDVSVPISETAIRYGLNQLRKTCWQQIAEPVDNTGGVISVNELYDRLTEYAKAQLQGKKTIPQSDPINRLLLSICALIEYNGEGWFGVHPLVVENLEKLGRLNLCEP